MGQRQVGRLQLETAAFGHQQHQFERPAKQTEFLEIDRASDARQRVCGAHQLIARRLRFVRQQRQLAPHCRQMPGGFLDKDVVQAGANADVANDDGFVGQQHVCFGGRRRRHWSWRSSWYLWCHH